MAERIKGCRVNDPPALVQPKMNVARKWVALCCRPKTTVRATHVQRLRKHSHRVLAGVACVDVGQMIEFEKKLFEFGGSIPV